MSLSRLPVLLAALVPFAIDYRPEAFGLRDYAELPQRAAAALLASLFLAWTLSRGRISKTRFPKAAAPAAAFLGWALVSGLWAGNRYEWFDTWIHWAASAMMAAAVFMSVRDAADARRWAAGLFWSGTAAAVVGLLQAYRVPWVMCIPYAVEPSSVFGHRNFAVHFLVLTLPLGFALWAEEGKPLRAAAYAAGGAVSALYLFFASSRAGWVAAAAEAGLAFVWFAAKRPALIIDRPKVFALAAGAALCLIAALQTPPALKLRAETPAGRAVSAVRALTAGSEARGGYAVRVRLAIWRNTLPMIRDHPWLGVGLGNHKVLYPAYRVKGGGEDGWSESRRLRNAHNDYLQVLAEAGPLGLLLLLLTAASGFLVWRAADSGEGRLIAAGAGLGLAGLSVNAFFSFPLHRAIPPFAAAILAGLLARLASDGALGRSAPAEGRDRRAGRAGGAAAAALAAAGLALWHARAIGGDLHFARALWAEKNGDWKGVIREGREAARLDPGRTEVLYPVGKALSLQGRHDEAARALETVVNDYPFDMNALLNLGMARAGTGRTAEAEAALRGALAIKPDYAKAHNALGLLRLAGGRLSEAREFFAEAVALDPAEAAYALRLGQAAFRLGDHAAAAEALSRAVELKPDWAEAHLNLGGVLFGPLGRKEEGALHMRRALELDPSLRARLKR